MTLLRRWRKAGLIYCICLVAFLRLCIILPRMGRGIVIAAVFSLGTAYPIAVYGNAKTDIATVNNEAGQAAIISPTQFGETQASIISTTGDHGEDRADRDLKAQEDMARWAFWMLVVAIASTGIGTFGVWLIWHTLKATRDAVKEAEGATEAARDAVRVTEESAHSQLRAWLKISVELVSCGRSETAARFTVRINAENVGQTPALNVANDVMIYGEPSLRVGYGELPSLRRTARPLPSLMPGESTQTTLEVRITNEEIEAIVARCEQQGCGPIVIVDTMITYSTIFDWEIGTRRTSARHIVSSAIAERRGDWLNKGQQFIKSDVNFGRDLVAPVHLT